MTAPLIGLLGRKRAGKDSFAARLVEAHGFERFAFADPLKETMLDLNPWLEPTPYPGNLAPTRSIRLADYVAACGWELAKENPEVRRLLQAHGVAIRTHVDSEVWVNATMSKVALARTHPDPVVIADVRFPNEADAVEAAGGILVRIVRPSITSNDRHISETALDGRAVHHVYYNDGTIDDLGHWADWLVGRLA